MRILDTESIEEFVGVLGWHKKRCRSRVAWLGRVSVDDVAWHVGLGWDRHNRRVQIIHYVVFQWINVAELLGNSAPSSQIVLLLQSLQGDRLGESSSQPQGVLTEMALGKSQILNRRLRCRKTDVAKG